MSYLEEVKGPAHVEHVVDNDTIAIKGAALAEAKADALAEGKPRWQVIRENMKTCVVILSVQTFGTILGLEYVLLGSLVGVDSFLKVMGREVSPGKYEMRAWTLSLWAGLFGLMQFLGQLFAGWFADRFGRKWTFYLVVFNVYIGIMTEVLSKNQFDFLGGKILMGTATGMMQVIVPTYVAEICPREIRGISIGMFAFYLSLGSLIGTLTTWGTSNAWGTDLSTNLGWHVPLFVGLAAPTVSLVLVMLLAPESPYWLVLKNRAVDAKRSLMRLHPNESEDEIERTLREMEYTVLKEREHKDSTANATYMECLTGSNLRRTFSALWPSVTQQFVGNQLVQSYSTYFFEVAGLTDSLTGSVITSACGLAAAIGAFFVVELKSVGRWALVFWGCVGMTVCMFGVGVGYAATGGQDTTANGKAFVFFIAMFNVFSNLGPGVAGWAYAGETGSARLRAKTATLATGSNAIIGTITNIVIPLELVAINAYTGFMFAGFGVIATILIYVFIPDVTGRTYAQLDELFERRIPPRQFHKFECTGHYGNAIQGEPEFE